MSNYTEAYLVQCENLRARFNREMLHKCPWLRPNRGPGSNRKLHINRLRRRGAK